MNGKRTVWLLLAVAACAACTDPASDPMRSQNAAPTRDPASDWPMYHRDYAGTRFSPLTAITPDNVRDLELAWIYRFNRPGRPRISGPSSFELYQEITPIVVDGIMYLPSGDRVVALDPDTGREIWVHELDKGLASFRGVAYWPGTDAVPARIFFTSLKRLIALNAADGRRVTSFGDNGEIALGVAYSGVPTIYRNRIIVGANFFGPGEVHIGPQLAEPRGQSGNSRAFDAVTGEKLWEYQTIPQPGEPGNETWGKESWRNRTGNNVWAFALTVDEDAGLVYMPVSTPGANYYGGDRPGNNEPANSIVALDAMTGEVRWYFQTIHHELWDYNLPPAAALLDLNIDGDTIPALAQTGKSAWIFILNRLTGEPVFGVEEKPVPAGDVPGEWYSPTQPIPVKPPPLARVSFDPSTDIVTAEDTTPAHAAACHALYDEVGYYNGGPYTPFNLKATGTPPSIVFPSLTGGVNWGGVAIDPERHTIFVNSKDDGAVGWTVPNPAYSEETASSQVPYTHGNGPAFAAPGGDGTAATWPCIKPPWSRLMAIDGQTGEIVWSVPLGEDPTMPEGKRNVGSPGYGGPMVTAGGLVFIGATSDQRFRAFDSRSGEELWSYRTPHNITAVPISYAGKDGRQYVAVVSARGGAPGEEGLYVFALPERGAEREGASTR
jgi:quinoprotein glucose dehydrogenase